MPGNDSFAEVMARLRAGDDDAAARIFRCFTHRLIGLARAHLDRRVRQKVDPEDVVQSVYRSFFLRYEQGKLDLAGWDSLWALLTVITTRKCGRWARKFHAERRDVSAEVPGAGTAGESGVVELFSDEPSPAEAVVLSELIEQLLGNLGQRDGAILTMALQGSTAREISAQLGRPARTVYRVLERIKRRLQAAPVEESPSL
jgi:RNA polymerase sigma-70 factor (ECF subfamily)